MRWTRSLPSRSSGRVLSARYAWISAIQAINLRELGALPSGPEAWTPTGLGGRSGTSVSPRGAGRADGWASPFLQRRPVGSGLARKRAVRVRQQSCYPVWARAEALSRRNGAPYAALGVHKHPSAGQSTGTSYRPG